MSTRDSYIESMTTAARQQFARHTLEPQRDAKRWMIRGEATFSRVELVQLDWDRIVVHGDIEPVLFRGQVDAWPVDAGFIYALQQARKAQNEDLLLRRDMEVAADDAERVFKLGTARKHVRKALRRFREGEITFDRFRTKLHEEFDFDAESLASLGLVPQERVFFAAAALDKLALLLRERQTKPSETARVIDEEFEA